VHSAREHPLWLMAAETAEAAAAAKLGGAGAHVFHLPVDDHRPGLDLAAVLRILSAQGITRLMVEGGARVASSFLSAGLVDEVWLLRGPDEIGVDGIPALDTQPLSAITQSPRWRARATEALGRDTLTVYERI
jgi:diaminohydroxyphosphoribosylaminopyrimidine deaminase/5-amino-6-(5-phosphoribosylamino)uracil reductase